MRKIEKKVCAAFVCKERAAQGNTMTDGERLYLHGNLIAWHEGDQIMGTLAGWNTPTTRSRLNAVAYFASNGNKIFTQKDFEPYFDDAKINDQSVVRIA